MILYIGRVWQTNQESEMSEQPGDKHPQGTPTGSTSQQVEEGQCCSSGLDLGATVSKGKELSFSGRESSSDKLGSRTINYNVI